MSSPENRLRIQVERDVYDRILGLQGAPPESLVYAAIRPSTVVNQVLQEWIRMKSNQPNETDPNKE